ncbi:MerR family transcriptional regulator [Nocardia niigatensis]|uniref:MerR family transcriptional regulator n=1 Tax=Nocardia niigatensis TaxID=209249 RepID=UPI0002F076B5|nr:MerR family transcriptional regulator [Nocardia niigatensis]
MIEPSGGAEPPTATEFSVGAVARRLGIPVTTLRSWNQRYGIGPQGHRPGTHRYYTRADLAVVTRMVELIRMGASPASAARAARVVRTPAPPVGDVAPVLAAAESLDPARLLSLLAAHLGHHGVSATWNLLCRPAFADIVEHQRRGEGYVDVEHLLSWAVTTSLHRGVPAPADTGVEPEIVLACTPGEQHVLPLEVLRAALAEHGRATLLLGASVPPDALARALSLLGGTAAVVLWSQSPYTAAPESIRVAETWHGPVFLAGPGWADIPGEAGPRRLHSLEEAVDALA